MENLQNPLRKRELRHLVHCSCRRRGSQLSGGDSLLSPPLILLAAICLRPPPIDDYNRSETVETSEPLPVQIVKYPHPTLRHKSKPLRRIDSGLKQMVHQMLDLMYTNQGIGLAANQVDLPYRLIVLNIRSDATASQEEHVFINPVIAQHKGGMEEKEEGCLSLPEIYAPVRRSAKILLSAFDLAGQEVSLELSGLYARVVQHECDHLDGVLFVDRLSPANLLKIKQDLEDMELAFSGERQRGLIPEDRLIVARLSELEVART